MWNLKRNVISELNKTETDLRLREPMYGYQSGGRIGEGVTGSLGLTCVHFFVFKMDNQQGPAV